MQRHYAMGYMIHTSGWHASRQFSLKKQPVSRQSAGILICADVVTPAAVPATACRTRVTVQHVLASPSQLLLRQP
jgi:hypothetical protein